MLSDDNISRFIKFKELNKSGLDALYLRVIKAAGYREFGEVAILAFETFGERGEKIESILGIDEKVRFDD